MPAPRHTAFGATGGRSPDDSVEPLGAERGIITKVEVDVALERASGVERDPAATARIVALVGSLPLERDRQPAIPSLGPVVQSSRPRHEAPFSVTVLLDVDQAETDHVDGLAIPATHLHD